MGLNQKPKQRQKLVTSNGIVRLPHSSIWYKYWRDPYHLLLTIPWSGFVALIVCLYAALNTFFALIYLIGGADGIVNARPHSFWDAFFFSVQTLASIGYGTMYPNTPFTNTVVAVEVLIGLIGVAIVTGLAFARFSRSTARIMFSRVAVVAPYNGSPALMFRVANQRGNQIVEAQMRVYLLRDEVSLEGQFIRRLYPLTLLRAQTPDFSLTWMAIHPINATSPLQGQTPESLVQLRAQIVVSLGGIDETVAQAVHARHLFNAEDILWNYRLVDIIRDTAGGDRYIDFTHFHSVTGVAE
ncbi:ion channel [Synechococcus sp. PCC 7335]|uniref:ion channel n=1 Tax=Synechococcus sp. (strain ATCC 29403 / PCC 7335) TaxID=91464 RepID=UPI000571C89B|nr:ion channel [Synechococcus sp. PCC 7335]